MSKDAGVHRIGDPSCCRHCAQAHDTPSFTKEKARRLHAPAQKSLSPSERTTAVLVDPFDNGLPEIPAKAAARPAGNDGMDRGYALAVLRRLAWGLSEDFEWHRRDADRHAANAVLIGINEIETALEA